MIELSRVWVSEWIVIGFFAYLIFLALLLHITSSRRRRVVGVGVGCIALAATLSQLPPSAAVLVTREWLPAVSLVQGYWLCGLFFRRPMVGVERWLLEIDRTLFRVLRGYNLLERGPRIVLEYFELTYLLVYAFVPGCFGLLCWLGFRGAADNYWTTILIAGFGAYGILPWIQTRPPRSLEPESPLDARGSLCRRLNLSVLKQASVQVNTFPSGHASTAIAAALAIASVHLPLGVVVLVLASSITVATVLGRYHYALDSVLGAVLGGIGWWVGFRFVELTSS